MLATFSAPQDTGGIFLRTGATFTSLISIPIEGCSALYKVIDFQNIGQKEKFYRQVFSRIHNMSFICLMIASNGTQHINNAKASLIVNHQTRKHRKNTKVI